MTFPDAEYTAWAKEIQGKPPRPLSWSNVPHFTPEELAALGVSLEKPTLSWGAAGNDGGGPLRERIAARRHVGEDRILIAQGTTGANFAVLAANLEGRGPHPVALVETPGFTPLERTLEALGYQVVRFARSREQGWALDPERIRAAWSREVAVVVLTNLHNPTGTATGAGELAAVARLCENKKAVLLSDEVYREFVPEPQAPPAYPISEAACTTESLSKVFGLAELRCGWAIGSPRLIRRARRILDHATGDAPTPARDLAARALEKWDAILERARAIASRGRGLVEGFLAGRRDVEWTAPAGGVHALLRLKDKDAGFPERLLAEEGVLVVPGRFFGIEDSFRIGWGGPPEKVQDALAGLAAALDRRRT